MSRLLCAMGFHKWALVFEDELERLYSCRRQEGGCSGFFAVAKGAAQPETTQ